MLAATFEIYAADSTGTEGWTGFLGIVSPSVALTATPQVPRQGKFFKGEIFWLGNAIAHGMTGQPRRSYATR